MDEPVSAVQLLQGVPPFHRGGHRGDREKPVRELEGARLSQFAEAGHQPADGTGHGSIRPHFGLY